MNIGEGGAAGAATDTMGEIGALHSTNIGEGGAAGAATDTMGEVLSWTV